MPEEFRTRGALARTQAHLRRIMDRADVPLVQLHKFLWDRFRSVRQDIYVQGFDSATEVAMIEEHVRGPGRLAALPRACQCAGR